MDPWNIQGVSQRFCFNWHFTFFPHLQHESGSILPERHWISWEFPEKLTSPPGSLVPPWKAWRSPGLVKDRGKTPLLGSFQATALAHFPPLKSTLCCQCDLEETLPWHAENNRWRKVGWVYDNSPHPFYKVHFRQLIHMKYSSNLLINITRIVLSSSDDCFFFFFLSHIRGACTILSQYYVIKRHARGYRSSRTFLLL